MSYDEFVASLARCYGTDQIPVEFVTLTGTREDDKGRGCWYQVRIAGDPVVSEEDADEDGSCPDDEAG